MWLEEEFGALKASGCSRPNWEEGGRGTPAKIFKIFVEINFGDIFQCDGEVLVYFDKVNMVKLLI